MNERERIELLMKCYELTPSQFADRTGIQRASVSHIISGRNKPSLEVLQKIYDAFPELDLKWLMTGHGDEPVANGDMVKDAVPVENNLFSQPAQPVSPEVPQQPVNHVPQPTVQYEKDTQAAKMQQLSKPVERQRKSVLPKAVRQQPVSERRIKEIRIFYTDGTYETMFPEK